MNYKNKESRYSKMPTAGPQTNGLLWLEFQQAKDKPY